MECSCQNACLLFQDFKVLTARFARIDSPIRANRLVLANRFRVPKLERGEKTPTPKISALLRKRPVLLRTNFVLTKDRKRPYYGHFCGKIHREGSCSKVAGGPS